MSSHVILRFEKKTSGWLEHLASICLFMFQVQGTTIKEAIRKFVSCSLTIIELDREWKIQK